jgi:hypothetical protein
VNIGKLLLNQRTEAYKDEHQGQGCFSFGVPLGYVDKPSMLWTSKWNGMAWVLIDNKALLNVGSEMDWLEDKLNERASCSEPEHR